MPIGFALLLLHLSLHPAEDPGIAADPEWRCATPVEPANLGGSEPCPGDRADALVRRLTAWTTGAGLTVGL